MPYAPCNNANIYYEIYGHGEPLLFINGLKTDHTRWFKLKELLATHYQVILFDNRATGRTQDEGHGFTVETMANDTAALIEYLNLDSVTVIGHSLGGATAQWLAYKHLKKIKRLFLLNTFLKLNKNAKEGFYHLLQLHEQGASKTTIMEAMMPWGFSKKFMTPEIKKAILELSELNPYPQNAKDYKRQYEALILFDSTPWINKIEQPCIVVTSKEDITATPQESEMLTKEMKNVKLIQLPGGHASPVEQAEELAKIINRC